MKKLRAQKDEVSHLRGRAGLKPSSVDGKACAWGSGLESWVWEKLLEGP